MAAKNAEDLALLDRCIRREPGAWQEFVRRFAPTMRALARRYLKLHGMFPGDADVDDILQEVFVAITRRDYRLLRNYDPTYTLKTYLGVIVRTEVHRLLRKKKPLLSANPDLERAAPPTPDATAAVETEEEKEVLARALERLPERDALVLRLRFFRELDYRAIANQTGIPEASVGQTLFRAKQRLLEELRKVLGILV